MVEEVVGGMTTTANFSVERMAAGGARLQIRALGARRHRSPRRWTEKIWNKKFKIAKKNTVQIVPHDGGCLPTDRITVDTCEVSYM